ncbi:MAG TPA: FUSC family protein [Candidatus Baltobacteraceae bacterium]|nr:FUSC family protein [Candidatus Baltobacteraceae bacterium]
MRCAIGVSIAILAGYASGVPIYAVSAAMGALSTGFASLQGIYRSRAANTINMALAMAFSAVVGSLCGHSAELGVLALAVWGFGYGLIASLGPAPTAIGVNAIIALIIFEHYPQPAPVMAGCALVMFGAGLWQTFLLVVLWPIQRYPYERHALAAAFRELAEYAEATGERAGLPSFATLMAVRKILADPRPFGRPAAVAAFQSLLNEADRIRASMALLATSGSEEYLRSRSTIVAVLREIADALDAARAPADDALRANIDEDASDPTLRALYGQLRAAWGSATVPLTGVSIPHGFSYPKRFPSIAQELGTIRDHLRLDSTYGRHAVRMAVVLVAAGVLADALPLARGYWVTLTAALVLRPDFTSTLSRGIARIAGTILGAAAATALVLAVPDTPHVYLGLAMFFAAISYAAFQLNYGLFSLAVTAYVVFILSLLGTPEAAAVENRLLATLIGGALAMISYLIWPTWESPQTKTHLRTLIEYGIAYARLLLAGLADPGKRDLKQMGALRTKIWTARTAAQESLERMLSEPESTHDIPSDLALGIMAATQRLGLANTALSGLYQDPGIPAFPALAPLADAFAAASIANAPGLRDAYSAVAHALANDQSSAARALLASCDLAVDSMNTIVELWKRASPA